jgi:hypothetical protein
MQQYAVIEKHHFVQGDRETETSVAGNPSSCKVFAITNDGARTSFPEINASNIPPPAISAFDKFQENLLQNYDHYRRLIHAPKPTGN